MSPKLQVIDERVVCRGHNYPNTVCDGAGRVMMGASGGKTLYSGDGGKTWREIPGFAMGGTYKVLPSGEVLGIRCHNAIQDKLRKEQFRKPFIAWLRRATSLEALANGVYEDDFAPMYIPELDGTDGDAQNYCVGYADHGLIMRSDGELLATMYGRFRQDTVKVPYFPEGTYQYRSWVCSSRDGGARWDYISTLGANDECSLPAISEGYCEPDLIETDGGALLAVMRTGGCPFNNGSAERYTPMAMRRSEDGGKTWGPYSQFCKWGVWPKLLKMRSGAVVCAAGRPGVFLLTSGDGGVTWGDEHIVLSYDAVYGKCSSGYNCLEEIESGVLGLFYDDVDQEGSSPERLIKLRLYKVE